MSFLTQSHQVFFGRHSLYVGSLMPVPSYHSTSSKFPSLLTIHNIRFVHLQF